MTRLQLSILGYIVRRSCPLETALALGKIEKLFHACQLLPVIDFIIIDC